MGLLEEINFFSDFEVEYFFPIYLVLLNVPSLIYEVFPFIFLISSQFLFLKLIDNGELNTFKNNGLDNFKILKLITLSSLFIGCGEESSDDTSTVQEETQDTATEE